MKRKIYNELLEWKNRKNNRKPLMVLGVRQCGKTYVIKEFCNKEFEHFCYINLLDDTNIVEIFSRTIKNQTRK